MNEKQNLSCCVVGALGKMGRTLVETIENEEGLSLSAATVRDTSKFIGLDCGFVISGKKNNVILTDCLYEAASKAEIIFDFTTADVSVKAAEICAQAQKVHIIGTTGFSKSQEDSIKKAARYARIVKSGNTSVGMNIITAITKKLATILDDSFDIEILEMHHNRKKDAPSGAALMLANAAAKARKINEQNMEFRRHGNNVKRKKGNIGFASIRAGNIIGEHKVFFVNDDERIEIAHISQNRYMFAKGAIKAARWVFNKKLGLYDMTDVLDIKW